MTTQPGQPPPSSATGWAHQTALLIGREIVEGWRLWAVSLVIGMAPFFAPLLPNLHHFRATEIREAMVWSLGTFFGVVFMILLGSGMLVRDLMERRLGFYFSRPFGGLALAVGRLLGTWVLATGCLFLLFAGVWLQLLAEGRLWRPRDATPAEPWSLWETSFFPELTQRHLPAALSWPAMIVAGAGLVLAVLLVVHGMALWLRARSRWLLLDGLGVALCGVFGVGIVRRLESVQALAPLVWIERAAGVVVLIALVLALWAQVQWGRNHVRRSHRCFSLTLWPIVLLGCLVADAYSRFVPAAEVDDLTALEFIETSPGSPWLALGGPTRHRGGALAGFLLNYETGESWPLGGLDIAASWMAFSADGGRAAWVRCERLAMPMGCEIWSKDLDDGSSTPPRPTGVTSDGFPQLLALSPDGRRVAWLPGRRALEVYDLTTRRQVGRHELAVHAERMVFLDSSRIRVSGFLPTSDPYDEGRQMIFEVNVDEATSRKTGDLPGFLAAWRAFKNPELDLLFAYSLFPPGVGLFNGATGEVLLERQTDSPKALRFLADGRLLLVIHDPQTQRMKLQVVSPSGELLMSQERDGVNAVSLGGEWAAGEVWLAFAESPSPTGAGGAEGSPPEAWRLYSWHAASGELRPHRDGMRPMGWSHRWQSAYEIPVGGPPTRLFESGDGDLVEWHPPDPEVKMILPLRP